MSSIPKPSLLLDWATHEAASYAVLNWHYSHKMPKSKLVKIGVWEDGKFIGAIVFGVGANNELVTRYGLKPEQGCELVRVALRAHRAPVTRMVSIALKMLHRLNPGLRMVVSYADPEYGHVGGIYKAGNWIYAGTTPPGQMAIIRGEKVHPRTIGLMLNARRIKRRSDVTFVKTLPKHRYLYPLDDTIRGNLEKWRQPHPKDERLKSSSETGGFQPSEDGAEPIQAHQH